MASPTPDVSDSRIRRHVTFLLVGGFGFALYLAVSNALHYAFDVRESVSAVIGSILPIWPVYQLQRRYTFRGRESGSHSFPAYVALQGLNAALVGSLSSVGARTALPGYAVFVIAGVAGVLVSYVVQSRLIFRKAR